MWITTSFPRAEWHLRRAEAVADRRGLGPMAACRAASGRGPGPPPDVRGKGASRRAREWLEAEARAAYEQRVKEYAERTGSSAR